MQPLPRVEALCPEERGGPEGAFCLLPAEGRRRHLRRDGDITSSRWLSSLTTFFLPFLVLFFIFRENWKRQDGDTGFTKSEF